MPFLVHIDGLILRTCSRGKLEAGPEPRPPDSQAGREEKGVTSLQSTVFTVLSLGLALSLCPSVPPPLFLALPQQRKKQLPHQSPSFSRSLVKLGFLNWRSGKPLTSYVHFLSFVLVFSQKRAYSFHQTPKGIRDPTCVREEVSLAAAVFHHKQKLGWRLGRSVRTVFLC